MTEKLLKRREFIKTATAASVATALAANPVLAGSDEDARPARGKNRTALFVWGGWKGHDPELCRDLFVPWLRSEGFEVTVSNTLDSYLDEELMSSLDLVVQIWTMGKITGEQSRGLLNAVRGGVGIAGWHGGFGDAFRENTGYQFMVGGQWVAHPGGVIDYEVNIIFLSTFFKGFYFIMFRH